MLIRLVWDRLWLWQESPRLANKINNEKLGILDTQSDRMQEEDLMNIRSHVVNCWLFVLVEIVVKMGTDRKAFLAGFQHSKNLAAWSNGYHLCILF